MKMLFFLAIGWMVPFLAFAQAGEWKLKKKVDDLDLKVYTRKAENSGIQEIKLHFTVDASLTNIIAVINDVAAMPGWVYSCAEARIVKRVSPTEMIYYGHIKFPLTMNDRDYVVHSKLQQNAKNKEVTITSNQVTGYVPAKEKYVRVPKLYTKWHIKPLSAEQVQVEYQLVSDPGGSIPDWIINLVIDKGPVQSIEGLKEMVQQPKYQNAKLAYIKDFPKTSLASDGGSK